MSIKTWKSEKYPDLEFYDWLHTIISTQDEMGTAIDSTSSQDIPSNKLAYKYARWRYNQLVQFLHKFDIKDKNVLDTGCGEGIIIRAYQSVLGKDCVYGCDIEDAHVELSKRRTGNQQIYQEDFSRVPHTSPVFDRTYKIVTALEWLHCNWTRRKEGDNGKDIHPMFYKDVLFHVNRSVAPGGYFIFDFVNEKTHKWQDVKTIMEHELKSYGFQEIETERKDTYWIVWQKQLINYSR